MGVPVYDCIIIGAGPGGLQAAIYLGRYNRSVLLLDRSGGRTWHAPHIENVLTHAHISGSEIVTRGMEQAKSFGVIIERERVVSVEKADLFLVRTQDKSYSSRFVIVASGVYDKLPPLKNLTRFLGQGYYTCIDCDGYKTNGRKLVVMGDEMASVNLAVAMKRLFTPDVSYLPWRLTLPESSRELLEEEGIAVIKGEPRAIQGGAAVEGLEMVDGSVVPCEAIMASFGVTLNDEFLKELKLKRDAHGFKYMVSREFESSLSGLYIVGPLNQGQDQVVIAAGEGATAALEINSRLLQKDMETGPEAAVCAWHG
jgi:thioredoxin reductase (NADPH)